MIDPQELILAQNYESMALSAAFQNLMQWLNEGAEFLEREVSESSANDSGKVVRARFIAWQQRKQIISAIQSKIDDARNYAKEAAEELDIERRIESDRSTRTEW